LTTVELHDSGDATHHEFLEAATLRPTDSL